jgi:hypothetical protein
MFCHFYNYSPSFSIYYYYCDYDATKLQLLSFYPSMLINFLNFSLKKTLYVKLFTKIVVIWLIQCGVLIFFMCIMMF